MDRYAKGLDRFRVPHLIRQTDKMLNAPWALASCGRTGIWAVTTLRSPKQRLVQIEGEQAISHGALAGTNLFAECDASGALWLTSRTGIVRYFSGVPTRVPGPPVNDFQMKTSQVVAADDHLLFASVQQSGLWKYQEGSWHMVLLPGLPPVAPTVLCLEESRLLWAGYLDGSAAVVQGDRVHLFAADAAANLGSVKCFLRSSVGLLAGGANGIALARGDRLVTLNVADAVSVRGVSGMLQASDGSLWLNGLEGVVRVTADEVGKAIASPDYPMRSQLLLEAGLTGPSPQLHGLPSAVQDDHGVFWFLSSLSLVKTDPASFLPSTRSPILTQPDVTVDGKPITQDHRIAPGCHTLRIEYAGRYITAPEKVRYRRKLEGLDKSWHDLGERTEAVYAGLRPGTYRFHVVGSNGEVWSQPDSTLQFTVLPRFYERTLFRIFSAGVLLLAIWLAVRARIASVTSAIRRQEEARLDERLRISRELHDTLLQGVQALILRVHVATTALPDSPAKATFESALATADRVMLEGRERVSNLRTTVDCCRTLIRLLEGVARDLNHDGLVDSSPPCATMTPRAAAITCRRLTSSPARASPTPSDTRPPRASRSRSRCIRRASNSSSETMGEAWSAPPGQSMQAVIGVWWAWGSAQAIGATLEFDTAPGLGTTVRIDIPRERYVASPLRLRR